MALVTSKLKWAPHMTVMENPTAPNSVILSDSIKGKKYTVSPDDLIEMLINQEINDDTTEIPILNAVRKAGLFDVEIEDDNYQHMQFWAEMGWGHQLEQYLSSRAVKFYDREDRDDARLRRDALNNYLENGSEPSRILPDGAVTPLEIPQTPSDAVSFSEILTSRLTVRSFVPVAATSHALSSTLWFGLYYARRTRANRELKSKKDIVNLLLSFGLAIDYYIAIFSVEGLLPGIYYYNLTEHTLTLVKHGSFREEVRESIMKLKAPLSASWTIVMVADFDLYSWLYRHERAFRNLFLEAGRLSQSIIVAGLLNKISTLTTPATKDSKLSKLLDLDIKRQAPIYTLTMGLDPRWTRRQGND